jgi:hypothetical protein
VEDNIQELSHGEVWHPTTTTADVLAVALVNAPSFTDQLKEFLANHITT